ncbi:MAG TPA: hypothetical protein VF575_05485 [Candidatus Saccharimonadales bacterium]|jgi:hypothetical protein
MSEIFPQSNQEQPKILELIPHPEEPSSVYFGIDRYTRGVDVTTTLRYLDPSSEKVREQIDAMLEWGIEKRGLLKNAEIVVKDPIGYVSGQLSFTRSIKLGEKPKYSEIKDALKLIYGDDTQQFEEYIFVSLVDEGKYVGCTVQGSQHNEIAVAEPDQILLEMEALSREFGKDS